MKRFLATTATALILSTGAYAASHTTTAFMDYTYDTAASISASEMIGMRVYASETDVDANMRIAEGGEKEWDDIGEVNDIILNRGGDVAAVIVGVGGFLGIGEKDVAVTMSQLKMVAEEGDADDYFLVVTASRDMLENAKAFERTDRDMDRDMDRDADMNDGMRDDSWTPFARPDVTNDGYAMAERVELTTENLTGARVYSTNGEDIGEVSEIMLNNDGSIQRMILDIGGFFGLGETEVPVSFEELNIQRSDDGDEFRVYIDATQEGLEQRSSANR